jgi:ribosome-associated translation inhibitor RaiA
MPSNEPKSVIVEFEDGSTRKVDYGKLSRVARTELWRLGNFPMPLEQKYVVLRWKNGWKEVMAVEGGCSDPFKYYILQRMEEHGRLGIERPGTYPAVKIIWRLPAEVEQMTITDGEESRTYTLSKTEDVRVEGGKTETQYKLEKTDSNPVAEIIERLQQVLKEQGMDGADVLAKSHTEKLEIYERLRRGVDIKAHEKQEDVLAFIDLLLRKVAGARKKGAKGEDTI